MRHRLNGFFPVFLLALLVQIYAPIGARFAMAAHGDSIFSIPICSSSDTQANAGLPAAPAPDHAHEHEKCSVLCGLAQAGAAPLLALFLAFFIPNFPQRRSEKHIEDALPTPLFLWRLNQARAPPLV